MPLGGATAAAIGLLNTTGDWRLVFYVGGIAPLLLAPVLMAFLPESRQLLARLHPAAGTGLGSPAKPTLGSALFAPGRAASTWLLWASFLFTLLVVYFLLNWLPSLLIGKGLTKPMTGAVMILFNVGGAIGCAVLGVLMDRWRPQRVIVLVFAGILASLSALASVDGFAALAVIGFLAGTCVLGAQSLIYALAPGPYPVDVRGTGVGTAIAIGRIGSVAGPALGGMLLAGGQSASMVIASAIPGVAHLHLAAGETPRCDAGRRRHRSGRPAAGVGSRGRTELAAPSEQWVASRQNAPFVRLRRSLRWSSSPITIRGDRHASPFPPSFARPPSCRTSTALPRRGS